MKNASSHNLIMIIFIAFLCFVIGLLLSDRLHSKAIKSSEAELKTAFKTGCFHTYTFLECGENVNIQNLSDSLYIKWRAK